MTSAWIYQIQGLQGPEKCPKALFHPWNKRRNTQTMSLGAEFGGVRCEGPNRTTCEERPGRMGVEIEG